MNSAKSITQNLEMTIPRTRTLGAESNQTVRKGLSQQPEAVGLPDAEIS